MTDIAKAVEAQAEAIWFRDAEPSRRPVQEWEPKSAGGHYLGVSSLIKKGAVEYAQAIIDQQPEVRRREDALWSFIGNTLGDAVLRDMTPHREVQVRIPIEFYEPCESCEGSSSPSAGEDGWDRALTCGACGGDRTNREWDIVGHLDGLMFIGDAHFGLADYIVLEHKARGFVDAEPDEEASRQAVLYLAMAEQMQVGAGGTVRLSLAQYQSDPDAQPAFLVPNHRPWGIAAMVCPRDGPGSITEENRPARARPVEAWERAKVLDFYMRKAMKILESVESKNTAAALEWDDGPEGILEHAIAMTAIQAGLPETFEPYVFSAVAAKDVRDKHDTIARQDEALACAMLVERELKSVIVKRPDGTDAGKATVVGGNGRRHYLRWTPRGAT